MKRNPFARLDVPLMLERLDIKARRIGDGRRLAASCPSPEHNDKAPSWFIRDNPGEPHHGSHKCQGCGFGGGAKMLAMTLLNLDEEDARAWLLDFTAPLPMPSKVELEVLELAHRGGFELPSCFRIEPLESWPDEHRDYLLNTRRVAPWQVERWGLGYVAKCRCPKRRHADRIAIPIRDELGHACSYTSRAIGPARLRHVEPGMAEHAQPCVFGEQHWHGAKVLVTTEGSFDALAVEALLGLDTKRAVVALRGSSPHPITLNKLTLFERIVVLTDPDQAGDKARAIINACGRHADIIDAALPDERDPSKLCETDEGSESLKRLLVQAGAA